MRKSLVEGLLLVVVSGFLYAEDKSQSAATSEPKADAVVGVDKLMKEADKYKGSIVVTGVVKASQADKQRLTVIDCAEYKECGTTNCAKYVLPIQWKGDMPKPLETVRVEGEVQKQDGKFIFVATKLETVKQEAESKTKDSK